MMASTEWTVLLSVLLFISSYSKGSPSVKVLNGVVNGSHEVSYKGRTFSAFYGIPYAKPPVGDLRFEPPKRMSDWTGVWIADVKIRCLQVFNLRKIEILGDEDCLYLNVYVPRESPSVSDKLDVIVEIHGGGFMLGSGTLYAGPNFLMDKEVILVTINYRLGPFGFLSTGDDVAPGNYGLKDQSFALKWVHENIEFFGGNPESVTLTGMSAGAASVHFHYLSPLSTGYFHRGISTSGTAFSPCALQRAPLEKAKALANYVGCDAETSPKLVECLRQRSALSIIENVPKLSYHDAVSYGIFGPVVERDSPDAFLTDTPYNLLLREEINDAPWITSFATDDGVFPAIYFRDDLSFLEENWDEFLPILLDYKSSVSSSKHLESVTQRITDFYLKGAPLTYEALVKVITDRIFAVYLEKSTRLQARSGRSPIYAYVFGYRGQHTFAETYSESPDETRVAHGDDVLYFFKTEITEPKLSQSDEEMKDVFLNLITSYARTGVPELGDLKWEPVGTSKTFRYLKIGGPQDITLEETDELTPVAFWDSLSLNENESANKLRDEL